MNHTVLPRDTPGSLVENDIVALIPALRAYARSLSRTGQDADDLVQETLLKALANIGRYEPGTRLKAWLFTIMRNTFYTKMRKAGREVTGATDCVSASPSVPATQEWAIRGNEVLAAIGRLPPHYRETLVLAVMLGERYEDAAAICNCSVGTIKSRINRARALVRIDLNEDP